MASDDFTGANGTALDTHDAKWTGMNGSTASNFTIQSNTAQGTGTENRVGVYYSDSQPEDQSSEVVIKGASPATNNNRRNGPGVRTNSSRWGYDVRLAIPSGDDWTRLIIDKNAVALSGGLVTGLTVDGSVDHTLKIEAITNGANVDLEIWLDTVSQLQVSDTSSVLNGGFPGFRVDRESGGAAANSAIDDWTDGIGGGVTITPGVNVIGLTGQGVSANSEIIPGLKGLSLSGQSTQINKTIEPGASTLNLTGQATEMIKTILLGVVNLSIVGKTIIKNVLVTIGIATLNLQGKAVIIAGVVVAKAIKFLGSSFARFLGG